MGNIVELFMKGIDHVVIDGGFLKETVTESERGVEHVTHPPGTYRYFVDVVEADGGVISMWDGSSYDAAMITARELSSDYSNAPIINRVQQ